MFSFFKKKPKEDLPPPPADFSFLGCDMHSHLVPGIDDGSQSPEESLEMILAFKEKGYTKLITTPHVHGDFYDNNSEGIRHGFKGLQQYLDKHQTGVTLAVSAEYYLDNYFLSDVLPKGLLSFGDNNVLVEVSMAGWPRNLSDMLFALQSNGYKPILAHPERYLYEEDTAVFQSLKDKGILMQMNLLSVLGYYGKGVKTLAENYMTHKLYDFCGSDAHHIRHLHGFDKILQEQPEIGSRLEAYGFKNRTLL